MPELLERIEFDKFTLQELVTTVKASGVCSNDKIRARMLENFKSNKNELGEKIAELKNHDDGNKRLEEVIECVSDLERNVEIWRVEVEALKSELENKNREFVTITNLLREMNEKEAETNNNDLAHKE